jgi:hypothetical protein
MEAYIFNALRTVLGDRRTITTQNLGDHLQWVFTVVWDLAGKHFPQHDSERVHTALLGEGLAIQNFRRYEGKKRLIRY